MKHTVQFILSLFIFHVPSIAQQVTINQEVKMLALGDSYTIGQSVSINGRWPHQFIDELRTLGVSGIYPDYIATTGWTTGKLIQEINSMLDNQKEYNLVSILIGVNNQYQGLPIEDYEPDLRKIIDLALGVVDQDTSRVLILSIPDYAYTTFGHGDTSVSREIDNYNKIKKKVADEYRIAYIDITPISREGLDNPALVAVDGLHPSEEQYRRWVEEIIPRLRFEKSSIIHEQQQLYDEKILVYPNPAGSTLQIDAMADISRICIINAMGSVVSDQMISTLPAKIELSHIVSGVYTLLIYRKNDHTISSRTIIVQTDSSPYLFE